MHSDPMLLVKAIDFGHQIALGIGRFADAFQIPPWPVPSDGLGDAEALVVGGDLE